MRANSTSYKTSFSKKVPLGLLFCIGVYLVFSFGVCLIMFTGNDPTANVGIFSLISYLLSGAISAYTVSRINRNSGGAVLSIITAIIFSALLFIVSLALGGSVIKVLMNILCYLLTSTLFSYFGGMKRNTKRKRR